MKKTAQQLREELKVTSQGKTRGGQSISFHFAFRLNENDARKFILAASQEGLSESLYARKAILGRLSSS